MEVKNNKKQEIIITLSDYEADTLKSILYDAYVAGENAKTDKEFDKRDMADWLHDMIQYAQGYYVDREGFDE